MAILVNITEPIIGVTDRTTYLYYEGQTSFSLHRGVRGSVSVPFIILAGDSYEPTLGTPIYIYDGGACVFSGTIDSIKRHWIGADGDHVDTLMCVAFEQCFDTLLVSPRAYFNQNAGDIVADLMSTVAAGVPVTLGTISAGQNIPSLVCEWTRLTDIFNQLATASGFIWGVDMSTQQFYFHAESTTAAPFTLSSGVLWESLEWSEDRADFRDRQIVRVSFNAFSISNEIFLGDGVTVAFNTRVPVNQVLAALLTTSTQSVGAGTFTGQPAPNDTALINDALYVFVSTLDNRELVQVLIGASAAATAQNFIDAINANPATAGIKYSLPTWESDAVNAGPLAGLTFPIKVKWAGSAGDGVALSASSANFSWSTAATFGGADGSQSGLSIGNVGADVGRDLYFQMGSTLLTCTNPPPAGTFLSVGYRRLGGDCIAVEDTALVALRATAEHGTGKYHQLLSDTGNTSAQGGLLKARKALAAYSTLPKSFRFRIDKPFLLPGQYLTVSLPGPTGAPVLLDGLWLIQEVNGDLIPGMETLTIAPGGHFRYTVNVINVAQIASYVNFWENLALIGGPSLPPTPPASGGGGGPAAGDPFFCRAILPGIQVVNSDILENRYRVTCPSGLLVKLWRVTVTAKVIGGVVTDYIADELVSVNEGVSFASLFPSGSANKIVLPAGDEAAEIIPSVWAIDTLHDGDEIRVDVLQADGTVSGIEIVLEGTFVSG